MSINNINNGLANNAKLDNQRPAQQHVAPTASKTTSKAVAQNSVSLTPYVQNSHKLQNKVLEAPVNKAKVDQLRTSISNGEYHVDPEYLASKIAKIKTQIFGF
ncbi:MAG: flagellar biosynthesis anti-sigma factor FlgM [Glaciecola sp.]|jgi:negative regulator of flagellin synthesis FlgM|nr:flagellar biosynthesis anti-sigma factor FlgM [Glaciecola sp.]MDG1816296.1 flagellar biosynthesis anti-sigma factor FlgM [Glaciecola sp.]MDG2100208.1 flagellar biosynthesis anti-sigma factor FlgM [Glaciecola sp.]